jgi:hypothetical protein
MQKKMDILRFHFGVSGCSSGVEHNLAKVGVARSIRVTRSIFNRYLSKLQAGKIRPICYADSGEA